MLDPTCIIAPNAVEDLLRQGVDLAERCGVRIDHPGLRQAILARPGFSADAAGRVHIPRQRLEAVLARQQPRTTPSPSAFSASIDQRMTWLLAGDGRPRPMLREDVVRWTRFTAALAARGVRPSVPGLPTDVPDAQRGLSQYLIAAEHSPNGPGTADVCDLLTARMVRRLDRLQGRRWGPSVYLPSPFILGCQELDFLLALAAEGEEPESIAVGSMPMMGVTAPCEPLATMALAIGECLASATILAERFPGAEVSLMPHPEAADLATGSILFGGSAWDLLDLLHRPVWRRLGRDWGKLLLTNASLPDQRALADRAQSAVVGALGGYRDFGNLGQLSLDEVFSPGLLLLDLDVCQRAVRLAEGLIPADGLAGSQLLDVVEEAVHEGGMFIAHASTRANHRRQYARELHLHPRSLSRRDHDLGSLLREAHAEAERIALTSTYQGDPALLAELRACVRSGTGWDL